MPCPLDEAGRINPQVTRFALRDGRFSDVVHIKPVYYQHASGAWRPLSEVCEHHGNREIWLRPDRVSWVHPAFLVWLMRRQRLLGRELRIGGPGYAGVQPRHLEFAATLTAYPDKNPETATVDGWLIADPKHLGNWSLGLPKIYDRSGNNVAPATFGAGSNQPQWYPWRGEACYENSTATTNKLSAPFSTSHRFGATGSIEGILAEPTTTLAVQYQIGGNATSGSGGGGAALRLNNSGAPFLTYHNGTGFATVTCPAAVTIGTRKVKADWSGGVCSFYIAHGVSDPWTLLGVAAMATNPNSAGGAIEFSVGSNAGLDNLCPFGIGRVTATIDGVTVLDFVAASCGQSGYTDTLGNAWAITRATAGRKAVVQSPVAASARSVILHGTDDWIDVPAAAIPPSTAADNLTYAVVHRGWNTPVAFGRVFSTQANSTPATAGIYLSNPTTTSTQWRVADGVALAGGPSGTNFRSGVREMFALSMGTAGQTATIDQSGTLATVAAGGIGDRTSTPARISGNNNGSAFQDFEFEALAIKAAATSDTERGQLTAYYRGGL
jgi:hypothetical protein